MAASENEILGGRERRLMESESRWLQKAAFALAKAEQAQAKLAGLRGADSEPIHVEVEGTNVALPAVRSAMEKAVLDRVEHLNRRLRRRRSLLR